MKYNDNSDKISDWTNKKLKQEAKNYHQLINVIECFGCSDLRRQSAIWEEIDKRAIEYHTEIIFNS